MPVTDRHHEHERVVHDHGATCPSGDQGAGRTRTLPRRRRHALRARGNPQAPAPAHHCPRAAHHAGCPLLPGHHARPARPLPPRRPHLPARQPVRRAARHGRRGPAGGPAGRRDVRGDRSCGDPGGDRRHLHRQGGLHPRGPDGLGGRPQAARPLHVRRQDAARGPARPGARRPSRRPRTHRHDPEQHHRRRGAAYRARRCPGAGHRGGAPGVQPRCELCGRSRAGPGGPGRRRALHLRPHDPLERRARTGAGLSRRRGRRGALRRLGHHRGRK